MGKKLFRFLDFIPIFLIINIHITLIEPDTRIDKYTKNDVFGFKPNNKYEIEIETNDGTID
jgi:hypothetical protein